MSFLKKIKYYHILLIISVLCLTPIVILCFYDRPSADDFSYSILTHQCIVNNKGLWELMITSYKYAASFFLSHGGTFFITILGSLQPGIFGVQYYPIAPLFVLIYMYASIRYCYDKINKYYFKKKRIEVISYSLWTLIFVLMWMPSITQGVYWFNGAANYTICYFALIANIGVIIEIINISVKKRKIILILMSCILSIVAAGGNVFVAFASMISLFIITFINLSHKKLDICLSFVCCLIRFFINYLSPGTQARAATFNVTISYFDAIKLSIKFVKNYIFSNFNLLVILFLISFTPLFLSVMNEKRINNTNLKKCLLSIIIAIIVLCASCCVPTYASNGIVEFFELRVLNVFWMIFIFLSIIIYYFFVEFLREFLTLKKDINYSCAFIIIEVLCCVIIMFGSDSSQYHTRSIFVRSLDEIKTESAKYYAKEYDEREKKLIEAKEKEIIVDPLYIVSPILTLNDLSADYDYWVNYVFAEYYGFDKIFSQYK